MQQQVPSGKLSEETINDTSSAPSVKVGSLRAWWQQPADFHSLVMSLKQAN